MALSTQVNRVSASGNGVTTAFSFPYLFFADTDLTVILVESDGTETVQTITTNYTVSGAGEQTGGAVNMVTAPASGETLVIIRNVDQTQELDLRENDSLPAEPTERALDRNVMMIQRLQDESDRSLKLSDGFTETFDLTLPTDINTANATIAVNSTGDGLVVGPTTDTIEDATASAAAAAASAAAAAASEALAARWATDTSSTVDGSEYSAKEYAQGTQTRGVANGGSAKDWAQYLGGTVDDTDFSAKQYAQDASASAALAQNAAASVIWNDVVFLTNSDSPYTVSNADRGKLLAVDVSGGDVTLNLPSIAGLDLSSAFVVGVKKTDGSGNSILIDADGTDTIDGVATKTISVSDSGTTLIPDTDPTPDEWTSADFGSSAGNLSIDRFDGDGSTTEFTLSVDPGTENNTFIYVEGIYQQKDTYSLSGTSLTFTTAPPVGTGNIEVVVGTLLSIGTPSDGTVTRAKLAQGAVAGVAVTTQTSTYAASADDDLIVCDTSGGAFDVDLPAATGSGKKITVKLATAGNILTIDPDGSDTVDGLSAQELRADGEWMTVVDSASGQWAIVDAQFYEVQRAVGGVVNVVTNSVYVDLCSVTLRPGTYVMSSTARNNKNGSTSAVGIVAFTLIDDTSAGGSRIVAEAFSEYAYQVANAGYGASSIIPAFVLQVTSETTYYLQGTCSTAADLRFVESVLNAVRVA